MTTWYFDSVNGSNANNGLSESTPKSTYDAFIAGGGFGSIAAGDTLLFRRGTDQPITNYRGVRSGADKGFETRYGVYGTSINGSRKVRWHAAAQVQYGILLNFAGSHDIIVEDFDVDARGAFNVTSPFYCAAQGASNTYRNTFKRCLFHGSGGSGAGVGRENVDLDPWGYVYFRCEFYDNAAHGLVFGGVGNVAIQCRAYGNGARMSWGGHGFSALYNRTDITGGWTLVSGTTYSQALPAHVADVHFCDYLSGGRVRLTKNTSTPTTPASGQYGFSAGTLYVNTGAAIPATVTYAWGKCDKNAFIMCESYGNIKNRTAPYWEGHGFAFDDYTSTSLIWRCLSHDNEGLGYSLNRGDSNVIYASVAYGNALPAVVTNLGINNAIRCCTFIDNNTSALSAYDTEVSLGGSSSTIMNMISISRNGDATYAASGGVGHSYIYGVLDGYTTGGVTGGMLGVLLTDVDLLLNDAFEPLAPAARAGGYVSLAYQRDFYGRYYSAISGAQSFGAVQVSNNARARTSTRSKVTTRACQSFREHAWFRKASVV